MSAHILIDRDALLAELSDMQRAIAAWEAPGALKARVQRLMDGVIALPVVADLNPLTKTLLEVLRELDDECLETVYGINVYRTVVTVEPGAELPGTTRADDMDEEDQAPLDLALSKWRAAGCPDV